MCDFGNLRSELARLEAAGVDGFHLDVMDGHFVPNLTYGMPIVAAARQSTRLPLDVHLMITDPYRYVDAFCEAGADLITFHAETVDDPRPVIELIRGHGVGAGIAVNPDTPLEQLDGCWEDCDLILVMSVQAGFGGQQFRPEAIDRLRRVRERAAPGTLLEVDGGISPQTAGSCVQAGARLLVVGSAIFRHSSYDRAIRELVEATRC